MSSPAPFPEENLALTVNDSFGYLSVTPQMTLNGGVYTVQPSIWSYEYSAVKILTAHATRQYHREESIELWVFQAVTALDNDRGCLPRLIEYFEEHANSGSSPNKRLPLRLVKIIVGQVLEALSCIHNLGVVHTDLKPDNILLTCNHDDQRIEQLLLSHPPLIDHLVLAGVDYPIVRSQPIPPDFHWDDSAHALELFNVYLCDFGSAERLDPSCKLTRNDISAPELRAPEIILGSGYDSKADIWALGCLAFELLTGRWLFKLTAGEGWTVEDDHLAKMMEFTGETFPEEMRDPSFFDAFGNLSRVQELFRVSVEQALANYQILAEDEIAPAAAFLRDCLHLNPDHRPPASELETHPWVMSGLGC
ncbi:kinase-like protein [Mycena floridula]|nr:kinase-like protein [Mycena floridula]